MARWSTKVAISLKSGKIEEKLLCRAYRESQKLLGHSNIRCITRSSFR